MPSSSQERRQPLPAPSSVPAAVDKNEDGDNIGRCPNSLEMSLLKTLPSKKSHGKTLVNQHKAEHRETRRTSNRPIS